MQVGGVGPAPRMTDDQVTSRMAAVPAGGNISLLRWGHWQGSGYNTNDPWNNTFCAWQNTISGSRTVYGGNARCRVPGR